MVTINREACTGCKRCIQDCIATNIELRQNKAHVLNDCFLCGHCVAICPVGAVSIPEFDMADVEEFNEQKPMLDAARLLKAIKYRRSIRNYQQIPVQSSDLAMLLQAGRYTATAKNSQGCRFIFVQEQLDTLKSMVWDGIKEALECANPAAEQYRDFYKAHKLDSQKDYLFRNAPAVLFVTAPSNIDAGLAIQNMEMMATALGMGFLYNGYLRRAACMLPEVQKWLGTDEKLIEVCVLLGYPAVTYPRTAPRKAADARFL